MSKTTRGVLFTVGYVAAGLIAVLAVGCLTYHSWFLRLFRVLMLQFIVLGLAGALVYASVQMRVGGYAILIIALFYVAEGFRITGENPVADAACYVLPVGFALLAGAHVQKSLTQFRLGRFISMGLIVGVGFALTVVLFSLISRGAFRLGDVWRQAFLGTKLGAAMGLGFELIDLIGPRPDLRRILGYLSLW